MDEMIRWMYELPGWEFALLNTVLSFAVLIAVVKLGERIYIRQTQRQTGTVIRPRTIRQWFDEALNFTWEE